MRRTCLVTGASDGFGEVLARRFVQAGFDVFVTARRPEPLASVAAQLRALPGAGRIWDLPADVTDPEQVKRLMESVSQTTPKLDVLINAVGKSDRGRATEIEPARLEELFRVNVTSALLCVRHALPLLQNAHGTIINIGSLASKFAPRWLGGYPTVKHALAGWTQQLRLELAEHSIHVMLVCPGPIQRKPGTENTSRYAHLGGDLPPEAVKPAGGAKVSGIDPVELADRVFIAYEKRKPEIIVPAKARLLAIITALSPAWGDRLLRNRTS